jgi:hypothetical protein
MSKIIIKRSGSSEHISPSWSPVRRQENAHSLGDYDVVLGTSMASVSLVEATFSDLSWMRDGFVLLKSKPIAEFNLYAEEPVPGGAMASSWKHGKEAFSAGADIDSYPKDKGTAPHTVWVKGYLWAYLKAKV